MPLPLSRDQEQHNRSKVESLIENTDASRLSPVQKQRLLDFVCRALSQDSLSLENIDDSYNDILNTALNAMISGTDFNEGAARRAMVDASRSINQRLQERELYNSQVHYPSIKEQLLTTGYVKGDHSHTEDDISSLLSVYAREGNFECTDPMPFGGEVLRSTGEVLPINAEPLKQAIGALDDRTRAQKKMGFIPISFSRSHWILLKLDHTTEPFTVTCWDPMRPSPSSRQAAIEKTVKEIYGRSVNFNYVFAGEQKNDSNTCGARIVGQACKDAGLVNALTQASPDKPGEILCAYTKELVRTDKELEAKVEIEGYIPSSRLGNHAEIIYSKPANHEELLAKDEKLAIVLQEIYRQNPSIDDSVALEMAKAKSLRTNDTAFDTMKQEVAAWSAKSYSTFFKVPKEDEIPKRGPLSESKKEEDDEEQGSLEFPEYPK